MAHLDSCFPQPNFYTYKPTTVAFKKLHPDAKAPTRNTQDDAGMDLYALEDIVVPSILQSLWNVATFQIYSWFSWYPFFSVNSINADLPEFELKATKVKTGIALEIPQGYYGKIEDRSSMGSKLLKTLGGVIDSGYRGDVTICLANLSLMNYHIKAGDKIAQIIIQEYAPLIPYETKELLETERGEKGFGSSGA